MIAIQNLFFIDILGQGLKYFAPIMNFAIFRILCFFLDQLEVLVNNILVFAYMDAYRVWWRNSIGI